MRTLVAKVMDERLKHLLARWRSATDAEGRIADSLAVFADHADHLLVIDDEDGHSRYRHYGRAFTRHFGQDLTGCVIDMLPTDVLPADRRSMLAFDYAFTRRVGQPLWRSYTARFDNGDMETWQRLVLPTGDARLVAAAYPIDPPPTEDAGATLLRLAIERVPVVIDGEDGIADLALSLKTFSDTQQQMAELEVLASRDPLTGVSNLRHFHHLAELELNHARRMGRSFALLALDIDHFKHINDSYGHAAGDLALKAFVAACRTALREPDTLARCGGEEFAVALPNTNRDGAGVIAQRLRQQVEAIRLPQSDGTVLSFTVSIGVSSCGPEIFPIIPDLLARADEALYLAKREGRNRVRMAD